MKRLRIAVAGAGAIWRWLDDFKCLADCACGILINRWRQCRQFGYQVSSDRVITELHRMKQAPNTT
jgi:hypothetical protein